MKITQEICDVYHESPRVGLEEVQPFEVIVKVDGKEALHENGVMCKKARKRLFRNIRWSLKPPQKRDSAD